MKNNKFRIGIKVIKTMIIAFVLIIFSTGLSAQYLTGVDPDEGMQGETLDLTISGQGTHFIQATALSVNLQQGTATIIMPQEIGFGGNEILYATFSLSYGHEPGDYDLRVSNSIDGNMYLYDAFEILENPVQPELVSIDPDEGTQGEVLDVVISGQHTHFQASTTTVALQQGTLTIYPQYNQVLSDTEISAHFSFGLYHPSGLYDLRVDNYIDGTLYLDNAFTLLPGLVPTLTGIDPPGGIAGTMLNFDVYGENTHFLDASGIMAWLMNASNQMIGLEYEVLNNQHMQGTIILPYVSTPGYYDLHVMNNLDGEIVLEDAFFLEESQVEPEILYMDPDSAYQGDFLEVNVFTQNTWFDWAQTLNAYMKKSGSFQNIYSQGIQIYGDEQLEVNFNISANAIPGYYDLYIIDDLDGQIVGTEMFYVIDTITGIEEPVTIEKLSVYPNPASDFIYLSSPDLLAECDVLIYNMAGQRFRMEGITLYPNMPLRLDIGQMPGGIYFVQLKTKQKMIHKKLIKY